MHYDVFIIGGGVNGCGVARDAAGRGFKVGLAEMNDIASGTSSASTKLIHGGLRYLEQYAFRLVREALMEREVIWHIAPHIVRPLRFILPYHKGLRPKWMLRFGLFIYDHLGGSKELKKTTVVDFAKETEDPLKAGYKQGFEYSDEQVDDARLVVLNARHAKELGADIMVRTKVLSAKIIDKKWHIELKNTLTGEEKTITASFLANMAGPWIDHILKDVAEISGHPQIRLVQGSHIVVPKLYNHDRAYIFQNPDGRIIFAIPYQEDFTLIGTTDRDYHDDPKDVKISDEEIEYLCNASSEYFAQKITRDMIVWSYSGVRSLYDNGAASAQKTTRDFVLKLADENADAPLLSSYGGKITTYRKLSEDVMEYVEKYLGTRKAAWTGAIPLPGGNFPHGRLDLIQDGIKKVLPDLDDFTIRRLARSYGTDALVIFEQGDKPLGRHFGHGLYEAEVDWLIKEEWAIDWQDILWRRSKLGLWFKDNEIEPLKTYLEQRNISTSKGA
ncbi:glycerol-3-phosphate dehydrogenase [Bartonella sp. HY038]|uniref:glycerol-3-phosphate dehydrogenase n=1 Tax=Bartonella sp. HY038 TaxID=2759660 RepID=UPI0015FCF72F|nr:glycerol-3-phosphate dehydrogenase [Bartonella sp. HY038]